MRVGTASQAGGPNSHGWWDEQHGRVTRGSPGCWPLTAAAAALTVAVWWTGGFSVRIAGIRVRSHSWVRPAIVALAGAALLIWLARARIAGALARAWRRGGIPAFAGALAAARMAWTLAAGIGFGTFAIGGADSYGYVGQARLLAHGRLTDTFPLGPPSRGRTSRRR